MQKWAQSARFLIVDDLEEFRLFVRKILRNAGWSHIDVAIDGQQGLDMLCQHSYDLCLLDLDMPQLDGLDVLHAAQDRAIHTDFLVLTASRDAKEAVAALQLGARDYLVKPFDEAQLLEVALQTLERRLQKTEVLADQLDTYATTHSSRQTPTHRADTILIVEDQRMLLNACQRLFTLEGYNVVSATTLQEAHQHFGSKRIDLVVLDLNLPDGNGMDFLRHMGQRDHSAEAIVISAIEDMAMAMQAGKMGARCFLPKPFAPEELLGEVRKALSDTRHKPAQQTEDAIITYIRTHSHRLQNRAPIAEHFNMHEKTVSRHVKAQTGFSFVDFLHRCKLEKAKQFLIETALPIKDIALRMGFATPQHFTRVFQNQEGCNPSTFRKQNA